MIRLKNVSKFYYSKGLIASGFTKINLEFNIGEFVAITGESGSGKSTLLNVLSGLDTYEEGEMYVNGEETSHYIEKDWEDYRRKNIGNIYQNFNLINSYSVYRNVELALTLNGVKRKERKEKVLSLLKRVNMMKYKNTKVSKLSGGQKQRVAIARALAKDVPVIIADEPTGNLDKTSASNVFELLEEISKDKLVIVVTHNYDQVAPYATRKITMHDGKVIEDQKIKDVKEVKEREGVEYSNLKLCDKIKLGLINTFNVLPKFVLLFLVYSFVVMSLLSEYSAFKRGEYEIGKLGMNYVFLDTNDHRVIMNKKDKSVFTNEEIEKIKTMENIDYINENDTLVDTSISWANKDETLWLSGVVVSIDSLRDKISAGRMPEDPNEVIIQGSESDYYLSYEKDNILNQAFYKVSSKGEIEKQKEYIIVGIIYEEESNILAIADHKFYVSDEALKDFQFITHESNSTITIDFMGTNHKSSEYSTDFRLTPNNWVTPGTLIVPEDYNYLCENNKCIGKNVTITAKNIYFEDSRTYTIEKTFNKNNITYILDVPNYKKESFEEIYNGGIYINPLDYNQLFDKGTYQMSIYVKDIEKIDETVDQLEEMGYHTLKEKDTLAQTGLVEFLKIEKVILTVLLIVTLFFISYFIIRLILKSRNTYYAIIRMLGGSKMACRDLLMIELLTICHLSYFLFVGLVCLSRVYEIKWGLITMVQTYFKFGDYIKLYIILICMSMLIAIRYARKLFKTSAMQTYREEV